jgi:integration host factor subunit beta
MATVTKKDLIDRISDGTTLRRVAVKRVVQTFLEQVVTELAKGNRLEFRDFGVFEIKERAARVAQNPKTLQRVTVPAKRTVKFKVGRVLRERLDTAAPARRVSVDGEIKLKVRSATRAAAPA